jgi:PIN like domain
MSMRQLFPGHYRPTSDEFDHMWRDGVFAFDANVLLNLYHYSPETRAQFFGILERLRDRIWLPHQAAAEYHDRRLEVISRQLNTFDEVGKLLVSVQEKLNSQLTAQESASVAVKLVKDAVTSAQTALQDAKQKHPDLLADDNILDQITELFDTRTGCAYSAEQLEAIHTAGEERYKTKTPPGFSDATKEGVRQYGDLVLWHQLMDCAKSQQKALLLITDERKEDWWHMHSGRTIGPRRELVQEMATQAGTTFYLYSTGQFISHAQDYLQLQDQKAAIEEVQQVRQQQEEEAARLGLAAATAVVVAATAVLSSNSILSATGTVMGVEQDPAGFYARFEAIAEGTTPLAADRWAWLVVQQALARVAEPLVRAGGGSPVFGGLRDITLLHDGGYIDDETALVLTFLANVGNQITHDGNAASRVTYPTAIDYGQQARYALERLAEVKLG